MRRQTAAALCAALLLGACSGNGVPGTTGAGTVPDPGRTLTIPVMDSYDAPDGVDIPYTLNLEAREWGSGNRYVVLAHMRPADMSSWFDFARLLAAEGYTAIAFNFRGYGKSESAPNGDFGVAADLRAVVEAARAEGAAKVYIIGASMGGTAAIAASKGLEIDGTVTLSAPDVFEDVNAVELATFVDGPLLLIAADHDGTAADDALAIAAGAKGEPEVVVLSGNQHGTNMFAEHGEEITRLILDFLAAI